MIVHINGWPGAGKYTIGRIVARALGARFIPNHAINAPGFCVGSFGTPAFVEVVEKVRAVVYGRIVRASAAEKFVMTSVLIDAPEDWALFERISGLATSRGCPFLAVNLSCTEEENVRRIDTDSRAARNSLTDSGVLKELRAKYALLRPENTNFIEIDVTILAPGDSAAKIIAAAEEVLGTRKNSGA